jgi:hypothetical protein
MYLQRCGALAKRNLLQSPTIGLVETVNRQDFRQFGVEVLLPGAAIERLKGIPSGRVILRCGFNLRFWRSA